MNIPGFTAVESLYNKNTKYSSNISALGNLDSVGKIVPQLRASVHCRPTGGTSCCWADFEDDERQVSWSEDLGCY
jgi:hypothetical protein